MMAGGGVHDGERFLSQQSFAALTTDRLTAGQRAANAMFLGDGRRLGFGHGHPARRAWRLRLGRRHGHDVEDPSVHGRQRDPAHPAGDDARPSRPQLFTDFWAAAR